MMTSRTRNSRRLLAGVVAVTLVVVASACGGDDDASAPATTQAPPATAAPAPEATDAPATEPGADATTAPETPPAPVEDRPDYPECEEITTLTAPTVSNTVFQAHVHVADASELWEKYCLEMDYIDITSGQMTTVYVAGELPFGQVGAAPPGPLLAQGVPFHIHLLPQLLYGYLFMVEDGINSWEDLRGKPIGITGELGTPHRAVLALMEAEGEDPDLHTFVSLNSFSNMVAGASAGQVAGMPAGIPHSNALRDIGHKEFRDLTAMGELQNPAGNVGGDPEWIEQNRDVVKNFMMAWLEGSWVMFTDPEFTKSVFEDRLGMTDPAQLDQAYQAATFIIRHPQDQGIVEPYLELVRENYPDPSAIDSVAPLLPDDDIFGEIVADGFFEVLEERYGPIPDKPAVSGL